jgi:hypothetical protein
MSPAAGIHPRGRLAPDPSAPKRGTPSREAVVDPPATGALALPHQLLMIGGARASRHPGASRHEQGDEQEDERAARRDVLAIPGSPGEEPRAMSPDLAGGHRPHTPSLDAPRRAGKEVERPESGGSAGPSTRRGPRAGADLGRILEARTTAGAASTLPIPSRSTGAIRGGNIRVIVTSPTPGARCSPWSWSIVSQRSVCRGTWYVRASLADSWRRSVVTERGSTDPGRAASWRRGTRRGRSRSPAHNRSESPSRPRRSRRVATRPSDSPRDMEPRQAWRRTPISLAAAI